MGEGNGLVEIELDRVRLLRFDFGALCRLEDLGIQVAELGEKLSAKKIGVKDLARIICAGLTTDTWRPTLEETIGLIDKCPRPFGEKMAYLGERLTEAMRIAMPEEREGNLEGPTGESSPGEKSAGSASGS